MRLLTSQKNQLFEEIKNTNYFNPKDFEISELFGVENHTTIKYKNSEYFFLMFDDDTYLNRVNLNYSPGENVYKYVTHQNEFSLLIYDFKNWLENLKKELGQLNLWDNLKEQFNNYIIDLNNDNSMFTRQESIELKNQLDQIMINMNNISLLVEQNEQIKSEISRIFLLTEKLGKFDWFNLFIGTIINCITSLTITQDNAQALFMVIKKGLCTFLIK